MKNQSGFTLIELLIVIALLGALAVGLLASLDPLEQFKKGDDTGTRNTVSEIQQAAIRYYAVKGSLPWGTANQTAAPVAANNTAFSTYLIDIVNTGELKNEFMTLAADQLGSIYASYTDESITVCFRPDSKSFRSDNNTKYNNLGTSIAGCPDGTGATTCYWCIQ